MSSFRIGTIVIMAVTLSLGSAGLARDAFHQTKDVGDVDRLLLTAADAITEGTVDWPTFYGVQQTGTINTTFDCFGMFGNNAVLWDNTVALWPQASFETPPGSGHEYLFAGSIWIGGIVNGDTLVSTGMDGWSCPGREYFPPDYPDRGSVTPFEYITDYSMRALFLDTMTDILEPNSWLGEPHIPLNVKVSTRSHIWHDAGHSDYVLYDVIVTNIGNYIIEEGFVGVYADADVILKDIQGGWGDDLAGSLPNHGIVYIIDNDGDPVAGAFNPATSLRKCFAMKLLAASQPLARQNFNWWRNSNDGELDFGPRQKGTAEDPFFDFGTGGIGTPEGDINKYYVLSHEEWDYDQVLTASITEDDPVWLYPNQSAAADISDGQDTKFLLSFGPVDLAPGENLRLLFAMISGDSVHVIPSNGNWLPYYPVEYLANLNFDNLIAGAALADEKAGELQNPILPPIGLYIAKDDIQNPSIEWDPWVFDDVIGYDIYLGSIPNEDIPYPGVVPPWLILDDRELLASTADPTYTFEKLRPGFVYYANIAHRTALGIGQLSEPVLMDSRNLEPPRVNTQSVFFTPDCADDGATACQTYPTFSWLPPKGINVEYYNIYRFSDSVEFFSKYFPFYDRGEASSLIPPKDTIVMANDTFYFYAMDTYAVLGGAVNKFTDTEPLDGAYYVVTAVNKNGWETHFSDSIRTYALGDFSKDFMVLTNLPAYWAARDSIRTFYQDVLDGYSYEIFSVIDTLRKYGCPCPDYSCCEYVNWQDLTDYKVLIVDEDNWNPFFTAGFESGSQVTNYLLAGGKLMYFGGFEGFISEDRRSAGIYSLDYEFVQRFFGVDNVYYYGLFFYSTTLPVVPSLDTCFGFAEAEAVLSPLPSLYYDQTRNPFSLFVSWIWLPESPPSVATFGVNRQGRTTHTFRSLYPETSRVEGDPVGVKTVTPEAETYLFGFNLWYMQRESARQLLDLIGQRPPKEVTAKNPTGLATSIALSQNYPNPFNPSTVITFELPRACGVTLRVYNILGQQVRELVNVDNMPAGIHSIEWHGDNGAGDRVSSGVYFYRLEAGDEVASKTMIMIK